MFFRRIQVTLDAVFLSSAWVFRIGTALFLRLGQPFLSGQEQAKGQLDFQAFLGQYMTYIFGGQEAKPFGRFLARQDRKAGSATSCGPSHVWNTARSSNGRTSGSGPANRGSSPCRAASKRKDA